MSENNKIVNIRGRSRNGMAVTLESWINHARTDTDKEKPCSGYALVHRPSDKELHTVTLGGSPGKSDQEMADMFLGIAQSYAEGMSGVQSFEMLAFYGSNEPQGFKPFQISGRTEFDGLATEGADKHGALAQGMRLTEMMVQGSFKQLSHMHDATRLMMQDMGSENMNLRKENREMFTVLKELLVEREKLAHDRQIEEMRYQRSTEERALWLRMAPPLINNILGKDIFPQSTADTALIEAAVEHLTPEHMNILSTVLPPQLWGPLASRMQQIIEEKEKNKMRVKELAAQSAPTDINDELAGES